MHTRQLTDKDEILRFLETDALYAAYAIGDLEAALFAQSEWMGVEEEGKLCALTLLFKGLTLPAFFLMGDPHSLTHILRLGPGPEWVFVTCRARHLPVLRAFYHTEPPIPMWRMTVRRDDFCPDESRPSSPVEALAPQDAGALEQLYAQGGADAFTPAQLAAGVFYGVRERGRLVSAAGTHLVSPTFGMGAVGNVYTDEAHRGRGYGTATASAVVAELFRRGMRLVFLNVEQANRGAIRIYQRLGFDRYCPFLETVAARRLEPLKGQRD